MGLPSESPLAEGEEAPGEAAATSMEGLVSGRGLGNPRFPLKGSSKGDIGLDLDVDMASKGDIDVDMDIDLDARGT